MFLSHNDISFILPGCNNQVYVGKGDEGERQYKTKKFLLWTFQELVGLLKEEEVTVDHQFYSQHFICIKTLI